VSDTFPIAPGITAIDTVMVGKRLVTSAYLVEGTEPALVETGPATSADVVLAGLGSLGMGTEDLAHIVVTHIHLDHAGGVGTLAEWFPRAAIWVHERGAPHLADPSRLVASTARLLGPERLRAMFGDVVPVPDDRIRSVEDGDQIDLGGRVLDVLYTPGHASHHVAFVESETGAVFTGDALGVHIPDVGVLRPATPPPDFDLQLSLESIERIRVRARSALLLSHFGPLAEIDDTCDLAGERIRAWSDVVRDALRTTEDVDEITALLEQQGSQEYEADSGAPLDMDRYDVMSSVRMNAIGLIRYWKKHEERERAGAPQPS